MPTVKELKAELKSRNLSTHGPKAELVLRLEEAANELDVVEGESNADGASVIQSALSWVRAAVYSGDSSSSSSSSSSSIDAPIEPKSYWIALALYLASALCACCNLHLHLLYLGRHAQWAMATLSCGWCGVSRCHELIHLDRYVRESTGSIADDAASAQPDTNTLPCSLCRCCSRCTQWAARIAAALAAAAAFGAIGRHTPSLYVDHHILDPEYFDVEVGVRGWPLRVHVSVFLGAIGCACGVVSVFTIGARTLTRPRVVVYIALLATYAAVAAQMVGYLQASWKHVWCAVESIADEDELTKFNNGRDNYEDADKHCAGMSTIMTCEAESFCEWHYNYRPIARTLATWIAVATTLAACVVSRKRTRAELRASAAAREKKNDSCAGLGRLRGMVCPPLRTLAQVAVVILLGTSAVVRHNVSVDENGHATRLSTVIHRALPSTAQVQYGMGVAWNFTKAAYQNQNPNGAASSSSSSSSSSSDSSSSSAGAFSWAEFLSDMLNGRISEDLGAYFGRFGDVEAYALLEKECLTIVQEEKEADEKSSTTTTSRKTLSAEECAAVAHNASPPPTLKDVKKVFRMVSIKYHPDKVRQLGEAERNAAEHSFDQIREAHDRLKDGFQRNAAGGQGSRAEEEEEAAAAEQEERFADARKRQGKRSRRRRKKAATRRGRSGRGGTRRRAKEEL